MGYPDGGVDLGDGYFLHLEKPKVGLSSCPSNITRFIEREGNSDPLTPVWITLIIFGIFFLVIFILAGCCTCHDKGRKQLIKELRNTPSYELHKKLENLYAEEIGIETECLKYVDRYPSVSFEVGEGTGKRIIKVVEDLAWVRPVDRDTAREEERVGLVRNERGSEDGQEMQKFRHVKVESTQAESAERPNQEAVKQSLLYVEERKAVPADRHVNP
jgi:hypothetical protein